MRCTPIASKPPQLGSVGVDAVWGAFGSGLGGCSSTAAAMVGSLQSPLPRVLSIARLSIDRNPVKRVVPGPCHDRAVTEKADSPVPDSFEFSADRARVDRAVVHRWMSEQAYWALGRSREVQDRAIDGSRNFGIYRSATGEQVAFARVVTDGATFAWICDVFVD